MLQTALMGFAKAPPILLLADLQPWQVKSAPLGCGKSTRPGKSLLIFRNRVKPRNQKYFASRLTQISSLIRAVPCPQEGRFAIVTDVG
jgi:hypothetical protein